MTKLPLIRAAACLAAAGAASVAAAALRQIEVEAPGTFRDPVIIYRVTVGGVDVQSRLPSPPGTGRLLDPSTPFEWGDDWLNSTELHLFNRTDKVIVAGRIVLAFSDVGSGQGVTGRRVVFLDFGRTPNSDLFFGDGKPIPPDLNRQPVSWEPGHSFLIRVGDYADAIKGQFQDHAPSQIFVIKGRFFFDDGMRWTAGAYATPDPAQRGQWIAEDPLYFPGDRENNWPLPGHRWTATPGK